MSKCIIMHDYYNKMEGYHPFNKNCLLYNKFFFHNVPILFNYNLQTVLKFPGPSYYKSIHIRWTSGKNDQKITFELSDQVS